MLRPRSIGRALRHRNFRLFLSGQGISVLGTWLTKFAISWMAYRLGGSPFIVGLVAFCTHAPTSLLAPVAGVLVDRWDRWRTIVVTQVLAMLQSAALAAFALTGRMTVGHLMALGAVQGVINAFDMPARQSFVRQMIDDRADLPNAIALNSSMVNVAKLVGPVVAAILVDAFGGGWCFAIDAASYLGVLASLAAMTVAKSPIRARRGAVLPELLDGVRYVRAFPLVRSCLLLLAATSVMGGAYASMMPVLAGEHLGGGPHTIGVLLAGAGSGALCGALWLASRTSMEGYDRLVERTAFLVGVGLVLLEVAPSIWLATPILFVVGLCLMLQMAATNTILQSVVDVGKLGRVMSLYTVAITGGVPVGAFLEGSLASSIGMVHTFCVAGVLCMIGALAFRRYRSRSINFFPNKNASPGPRAET